MPEVKIGGFQSFSTADFPGKLAATVFVRGCRYRCPYCQNAQLQERSGPSIPLKEVLEVLKRREGLLEAVVVSGGEPLESDIVELLAQVRELGYETGLHTSGSRPEVLQDLLTRGLIDWVGLDFKAPDSKTYRKITGLEESFKTFLQCFGILLSSEIPFEVRTTIVKPFKSSWLDRMKSIGELAPKWYLQTGRSAAAKRLAEKKKKFLEVEVR